MRILLLLSVLPFFAPSGGATKDLRCHDESISSSRIDVRQGEILVALRLSNEDVAAIQGPLEEYLAQHFVITSDGEPLTRVMVSDTESGKTRDVVQRFSGRVGALRLRVDLFRDVVRKHKHIADFSDGRTLVFDGERVEAGWTASPSLLAFVWLGMEHILTGWDHLVFLVALLLIAAKLGSVVRLVTAFTVAHSITLALTALRVIGPPSFVEPVIAASIIYVALENLALKDQPLDSASGLARDKHRWRWLLVFVFGLVHGMGFGGVLVEMELTRPVTALLGFNLGVELGQLAVVAVVFPLLMLARRREVLYRKGILRLGSLAAAGAGLVWFVQRIA